MTEVVGAFAGCELFEQDADAVPDVSDGSFIGLSQQGLELGEHHLDRVQVGAVGRQEQEVCAGSADGAANIDALVATKVVEDHDIAGPERWCEELLNPGEEDRAVDRAIDNAGCLDAVRAQGCEEGQRLAVSVWYSRDEALAPRGTAVGAGHVGLGPGLIDEHQARRVDAALIAAPTLALARDVGPMLLGGVQAFF